MGTGYDLSIETKLPSAYREIKDVAEYDACFWKYIHFNTYNSRCSSLYEAIIMIIKYPFNNVILKKNDFYNIVNKNYYNKNIASISLGLPI